MKTKKRYMPLPKGKRFDVAKFEEFCKVVGLSFYLLGGLALFATACWIAGAVRWAEKELINVPKVYRGYAVEVEDEGC